MSQEMKVKILSVNLALKRELAYREKLARLYPNDDSVKHFSPLQAPSAAKNPSPNQGSSLTIGQSSHRTEVHQVSIPPPCQEPSSAIILSPALVKPMSMTGVVQQQSIQILVIHPLTFLNEQL